MAKRFYSFCSYLLWSSRKQTHVQLFNCFICSTISQEREQVATNHRNVLRSFLKTPWRYWREFLNKKNQNFEFTVAKGKKKEIFASEKQVEMNTQTENRTTIICFVSLLSIVAEEKNHEKFFPSFISLVIIPLTLSQLLEKPGAWLRCRPGPG